jgi:hypothetical protein
MFYHNQVELNAMDCDKNMVPIWIQQVRLHPHPFLNER